MTSGALAGLDGTRRWSDRSVAFVSLIAVTAAANGVNVLSQIEEHRRDDRPIAWWEPAIWEATSGIALVALAAVPMAMIARFDFSGRGWWRSLLAHLGETLPFSLGHVALMIAMRHLAYAAAGETYEFAGGIEAIPYEYRKDLLSYFAFAALFWAVPRLRRRPEPVAPQAAAAPDMFEIDEGQRLIRVPCSSLRCARSSGNYVEFFLADGRRPLMRTTLARVEAMLSGAGFVRTHRSWLVNPDAVTEAIAEGSGDYGLRLVDGTQVPLSRRYPEALAVLRGGTRGPRKAMDI